MTKQQVEVEIAIAVRKERTRIEHEILKLQLADGTTSKGIEVLSQLYKAIQPPSRRLIPR